MKKIFLFAFLTLFLTSQTTLSQQLWSLDDCLGYAIIHSSKLSHQTINEYDAQITLSERRLAFLPSLSSSVDVNTNFGRSIDSETNTYVSTANLSNSYSAYASVNLFNGLQTINNLKIAKISKLKAELLYQQIENQVATNTMNAYYQVIFTYGAYKIAIDELTESNKMYYKKKVEYEVGLANLGDLAQLESRVSQGEYNITNLRGLYRGAIIKLKNEMFFPLADELTVDTLASASNHIFSSKDSVSEVLLLAKDYLPEFKISNAEVRIAQLNLLTAKAKLFPTISANGGISTGYSKFLNNNIASRQIDFKQQLQDRLGQNFGINVSIPLFNGLQGHKDIMRKNTEQKRVEIQRTEQTREIESMIYIAVIDLESYQQQCNQSLTNVKANDLSYRTTQAKYKEGLVSVIDLQTTQTNLSRAKIDQLKAYLNYQMQQRIVDYYKGTPLAR